MRKKLILNENEKQLLNQMQLKNLQKCYLMRGGGGGLESDLFDL